MMADRMLMALLLVTACALPGLASMSSLMDRTGGRRLLKTPSPVAPHVPTRSSVPPSKAVPVVSSSAHNSSASPLAIPGYGNFGSINEFVGHATSSLPNLLGLPLALSKLATIPGGIAKSLGAEGTTYLQVGLALAVGDQKLANRLIDESEVRKGVVINGVLNNATTDLNPFSGYTKVVLCPIMGLVGLKCNGTGVSQDATSSTLPSLPSFPSSTSPLKTPAGDASTLFKLPSSSTPGSTASGTGGLPFSLPSASSQQNPAGSLLGQFSDPFSFGTKSIEDDAAAPSGPADDPEDDEAHHPYEENETHG